MGLGKTKYLEDNKNIAQFYIPSPKRKVRMYTHRKEHIAKSQWWTIFQ